jgi:branched-chain amino acid transport system substrate-binding protein
MNNILVISPTSTSTELSNLQYTVLRTVPSDYVAVENLNRYILSKIPSGAIRPVIAYDRGESYSESIKDNFIEVTKQKNIPLYDLKTYNARQIIDEAQKINANVLLLAPSGTEEVLDKALELVKEVANIQNNQLILLGTSTLYNPATVKGDLGFKAEKTKLVTAVPWHRSDILTNLSDFEKESDQIWGGAKINWVTMTSYDAVQAITKGLSTITGQATRQSLKDNILNNLENFTAEGAVTTIQFDTQQEKGSRKPNGNGKRLEVLVKVECKNSCNFVEDK